jgi:2-phosphosulfolactate phosphatase
VQGRCSRHSKVWWAGSSTEARTAAAAFRAVEGSLEAALLDCASGQELVTAGFAEDVRLAAALDVSDCVPVLDYDRFTAVPHA